MMRAMGNNGDRSSGVTGCLVPGCNTGSGALGRSAAMLYQERGISSSFRRNLVCTLSGKVDSSLGFHKQYKNKFSSERQGMHNHGNEFCVLIHGLELIINVRCTAWIVKYLTQEITYPAACNLNKCA